MALPDNFSPWEHLQSTLMLTHNRLVREEFSDFQPDDDISVARGSLKVACLLRDDDSAIMTILRFWLFYGYLRKAADFQPPSYTIPCDRYQQEVKFAPQVTLYFREDLDDLENGYKPLDAELSFRLINENYNTFTPANALTLANRIAAEFATGGGYRWQKGRVKLTYRKKEDGYQFSVNAYSESVGRSLINKVLDLQNHRLDDNELTISQLAENPPIAPPVEVVYGESRRLPRRRPVGYVRFKRAECHVWGVMKPIILVDTTLRHREALVRV